MQERKINQIKQTTKKVINMKELNKLENDFLIFASSLSTFESQLKKGNFKQEDLKLLAFQTINKLKDTFNTIDDNINSVRSLKNL